MGNLTERFKRLVSVATLLCTIVYHLEAISTEIDVLRDTIDDALEDLEREEGETE